MAKYKALFKCRLCGKTFINSETSNEIVALNAAIKAIFGKMSEPLVPTLYDIHICDNGGIGIADFIGFRKDDEKDGQSRYSD